MSKFGWDYPPGCHSLPWDEEEDERCAIERWLDRWLGTTWRFKQLYIQRSQFREKNGWRLTLTLFWVFQFYLYWHGRTSFNLRLSLLKAGRCHPDEREIRFVFEVNAITNLTLDRFLYFNLSRAMSRREKEAARIKDPDSDFFGSPMKTLWQHRYVFEKWKGYEAELETPLTQVTDQTAIVRQLTEALNPSTGTTLGQRRLELTNTV